jgi:hypothetical protein
MLKNWGTLGLIHGIPKVLCKLHIKIIPNQLSHSEKRELIWLIYPLHVNAALHPLFNTLAAIRIGRSRKNCDTIDKITRVFETLWTDQYTLALWHLCRCNILLSSNRDRYREINRFWIRRFPCLRVHSLLDGWCNGCWALVERISAHSNGIAPGKDRFFS